MEQTALLQGMKEKAEAVQAEVSYIKDYDEAFRYALDLTDQQGGKTIAAPALSDKDQEMLKAQCEAAGVKLLETPLRPHANEIHTSLTHADWGIAETGTLVLDSSKEDIRIATMLANTHVAVLETSNIRPDTEALEQEMSAILNSDSPAYLAFITGASRTADIERVLAIGVHGPEELHILIMADPSLSKEEKST